MARRRCRIDFDRSISGLVSDINSASSLMSHDSTKQPNLIRSDTNEIKEEEETESDSAGNSSRKTVNCKMYFASTL